MFQVFSAKRDGEMLGYCATLVKESGGAFVGYIMDLCVLPRMNAVVYGLLEDAVEGLKKRANTIKYLAVEGHPNVKVFYDFGFASTTSRYDIRYKERHPDVRHDLERFYNASSSSIFLQYGDTDIF
jgi:hypothetical protein